MYELCPETPADTPEVEALMDLCFAPGRTALSSYRLREGVAPVAPLCLMLRNDYGVPVGAIRYWPVRVGGHPVLLLGPVAVHPTRVTAMSATEWDVMTARTASNAGDRGDRPRNVVKMPGAV